MTTWTTISSRRRVALGRRRRRASVPARVPARWPRPSCAPTSASMCELADAVAPSGPVRSRHCGLPEAMTEDLGPMRLVERRTGAAGRSVPTQSPPAPIAAPRSSRSSGRGCGTSSARCIASPFGVIYSPDPGGRTAPPCAPTSASHPGGRARRLPARNRPPGFGAGSNGWAGRRDSAASRAPARVWSG